MNDSSNADFETDPRFPSGPWAGYFLQKALPGKHQMELRLAFRAGQMLGEGRDWVGAFTINGQYDIVDGKCWWHKKYVGKHDVYYKGFNEDKGIWGIWEISHPSYGVATGGFHIWPEGIGDGPADHLEAEAEPPVAKHEEAVELVETR
ncbi:MAG: hypothetical protein EXS16_03505 [Gemmataceae bacterium]|nr:hypothetical protein [Gemmataceae bacterium]